MIKIRIFLYIVFSLIVFIAVWQTYGAVWAWVFGGVACAWPDWLIKTDKPEDKQP